jgi:hypothetical protein
MKKKESAPVLIIPLMAALRRRRESATTCAPSTSDVFGAGMAVGATIMALIHFARAATPTARMVPAQRAHLHAGRAAPRVASARKKTDLVFIGKADRVTGETNSCRAAS